MSVFKPCDIRGRVGTELTEDVAETIAKAFGTALARRGMETVLVGGDLRPSTSSLKEAAIRGLISTGRYVLHLGTIPTPAFYFAKEVLDADAGLMVTGSHNPPSDNGLKIAMGSLPITEEELSEIRDIAYSGEFTVGKGRIKDVDCLKGYKEFMVRRFGPPRRRGMKIVVDAGNGSYWDIAPDVFGCLGYEVVGLFCEPDGRFPNRGPNPASPENLVHLQRKVIEEGADMGVAFDGDGDRVAFVDDRGRIVENDKAIAIFIRRLLGKAGPGAKVVYDIKCSSIVPEEVLRLGGKPIMERSGHAFIKRRMITEGAIMAGEISGHFFFGDIGRDDGLFSSLLMADILSESGRKLSELADEIKLYPITPDIRIPSSPEETRRMMEEVKKRFSDRDISTIDGIRVQFEDGWALIRPSVTEPLITMRFEARTEERLEEIKRMFLSWIKSSRERRGISFEGRDNGG
jgi:phosphomannomutase/phosphoglucomutase